MNSPPALNLCMEVLGADRIMFAVDYPYGINEPLVRMIEDAPLSSSDRAKIFHRTAERVFGI
jgi:predicted TIM-barrel fold metal-dependent hydrolase